MRFRRRGRWRAIRGRVGWNGSRKRPSKPMRFRSAMRAWQARRMDRMRHPSGARPAASRRGRRRPRVPRTSTGANRTPRRARRASARDPAPARRTAAGTPQSACAAAATTATAAMATRGRTVPRSPATTGAAVVCLPKRCRSIPLRTTAPGSRRSRRRRRHACRAGHKRPCAFPPSRRPGMRTARPATPGKCAGCGACRNRRG